jgi:hypothetical protein
MSFVYAIAIAIVLSHTIQPSTANAVQMNTKYINIL